MRDLAARLGTATYRYLYSPALLHSEAARDALLAEPSIGHTMARARSADIALVGVGTFGAGSSSEVVAGLGLTKSQRDAFSSQKPVGDTCCRFFDAEGRAIRGAVHDRVLAVDLDDLRRIPTVIGRGDRPGQNGRRTRGTSRWPRRRPDHRRGSRPLHPHGGRRVVARRAPVGMRPGTATSACRRQWTLCTVTRCLSHLCNARVLWSPRATRSMAI